MDNHFYTNNLNIISFAVVINSDLVASTSEGSLYVTSSLQFLEDIESHTWRKLDPFSGSPKSVIVADDPGSEQVYTICKKYPESLR